MTDSLTRVTSWGVTSLAHMKAVGMLTTLLVAIVGVAKGSIYPVDITFQTPTLELITEG